MIQQRRHQGGSMIVATGGSMVVVFHRDSDKDLEIILGRIKQV
ncbi:hypothetical protein DGWBC_0426 [Dehalogenimonas sp. WBC-2]|nr:hypothetical protein DGWBC_0426 [Dehalogenimonas sp. WBC-2]